MITETVQRWVEGRDVRRPVGEKFKASAYDVVAGAPGKDSIAARFVRQHHYAGRESSTARPYLLYGYGELVGVALFGPPASSNAHRFVWGDTLTQKQAVTLGRFVLLDSVPDYGESWFLARCFEQLRDKGVIGVESCADPQPRTNIDGDVVFRGHLGTIYCATNGRYIGKTNDSTLRLLPDASVLSNRAQGKIVRDEPNSDGPIEQLLRWGADPMRRGEDPEAWLEHWRNRLTRKLRHRGNHRYIWCINRRWRSRVLPRHEALPYPKNEDWLARRRA